MNSRAEKRPERGVPSPPPGRLIGDYVAWMVKAMGLFGSKHKEGVDGNKDKDLAKPKIPRTAVVSFVYKVAR